MSRISILGTAVALVLTWAFGGVTPIGEKAMDRPAYA
jgi:hypothetical protein